MRRLPRLLSGVLLIAGFAVTGFAQSGSAQIGINIVLKVPVNSKLLADLGRFGAVRDVVPQIQAVTVQAPAYQLAAIQALSYVAAANPDSERNGAPVDAVPVTDFGAGISTWNLDAINVTNIQTGPDRVIPYDGSGVYVAVLDTGLLDSWRQYFPEERIASQYGIAFGGGGGNVGSVSSQPLKWEHDQDSHGTHVTSTILGYSLNGTPINGVAPMATVIPVKVLNQNGSGWSSVIARGITYAADLKAQLDNAPVVINMSLGGGRLDAMEKAAVDYAISKGVIVVASAGNNGAAGMGYPGAYAPVISVAAAGWIGEFVAGGAWWYASQVPDPASPEDFYIADFSSRAKAGQDLDVAAPGSWVVGPYQTNSGQTSYYFLGGTSMASPHVAGIIALMAQKYPALTAAQAETALETSAMPLDPGCRAVYDGANTLNVCWDADAAGAGLATADAALAAVDKIQSTAVRSRKH